MQPQAFPPRIVASDSDTPYCVALLLIAAQMSRNCRVKVGEGVCECARTQRTFDIHTKFLDDVEGLFCKKCTHAYDDHFDDHVQEGQSLTQAVAVFAPGSALLDSCLL